MRRIAILLMLALAACNAPEGSTRLPVSTSAGIGLAGTLLAAERAQVGTAPVTQNAALQAAAQAHAADLAARRSLSHTGSDGSSVMDRIARAGYQACFGAENIARGQPSVEAVMTAWRKLPRPLCEHDQRTGAPLRLCPRGRCLGPGSGAALLSRAEIFQRFQADFFGRNRIPLSFSTCRPSCRRRSRASCRAVSRPPLRSGARR